MGGALEEAPSAGGELAALRAEVREVVHGLLAEEGIRPRPNNSLAGTNREFSRKLAALGLAGTTIPEQYGGRPRTAREQWVIAEELLAASAPLASHWVCDRQIARMMLRFGTDEVREEFLPLMARGEVTFALGMSEPGAGSDLSAVRMRAKRDDYGWRLSGQKIWTTNAHAAEYALVLCRTEESEDKHAGLSQIIVDLESDGVEVRRIPTIDGDDDFCEVFFDDVFVSGERLLGTAGSGWKQITTELSFERGWPDRYLTNLSLIEAFRDTVNFEGDEQSLAALGAMLARLSSIRGLSLDAIALADAGSDASVTAAIAKDAGTVFEQDVVEQVRTADLQGWREAPGPLRENFRRAVAISPLITVRGGTTEILRGIIAKGIKPPVFKRERTLLEESIEEILAKECSVEQLARWEEDHFSPELWAMFEELGFSSALAGGAGQEDGTTLADAFAILRLAAYYAAPVPVAEGAFLSGWFLRHAGVTPSDGELTTIAPTRRRPVRLGEDGRLAGSVGVPFAAVAERILLFVENGGGGGLASVPRRACALGNAGGNEYARPVDVDFTGVAPDRVWQTGRASPSVDELYARGALARAVQMVGAMERAVDLSVEYAHERQQFGRSIVRFQAVRDHLAVAAREVALARAAAGRAIDAVGQASFGDTKALDAIASAKSIASEVAFQVSRRAHQVHAATGYTREYPLHFLTAPLAAWREEFGGEREWNRLVGSRACSAESAWDFVTAVEVTA